MKAAKMLSSHFKHYVEFIENNNEGFWTPRCGGFAQIVSLTENGIAQYDGINFGHLTKEEYFIITVRYLRLINQDMRIRFKNRIFAIKRIINPKLRTFPELCHAHYSPSKS